MGCSELLSQENLAAQCLQDVVDCCVIHLKKHPANLSNTIVSDGLVNMQEIERVTAGLSDSLTKPLKHGVPNPSFKAGKGGLWQP
ncbi:MAG: hypothetical protein ACI8RZ_008005 [Myxococcota bacterium]